MKINADRKVLMYANKKIKKKASETGEPKRFTTDANQPTNHSDVYVMNEKNQFTDEPEKLTKMHETTTNTNCEWHIYGSNQCQLLHTIQPVPNNDYRANKQLL